MEQKRGKVHVDDTEASAGSKEGVVRWVLIIGTFLTIAALTLIWVTGAATQGSEDSEIDVSSQIAEEEAGNSTDSIVGENADRIEGAADEAGSETPLNTVEN